jgi:hypothetical protein
VAPARRTFQHVRGEGAQQLVANLKHAAGAARSWGVQSMHIVIGMHPHTQAALVLAADSVCNA